MTNKLYPPGDVDNYKSTIEVSKDILLFSDVMGYIVTITLLDRYGNVPNAYRMARTTVELEIEEGAVVVEPPVRGRLDPVNVFKAVIMPLNRSEQDVRVLISAIAVRKADYNGNDANTVNVSPHGIVRRYLPGSFDPIMEGLNQTSTMHIDPRVQANDALQFATTFTVHARGLDILPITTDISPLLELHVADLYPSQRGGQKMDIGKFVVKDLANGVYTATFATDRISKFEMRASYKGSDLNVTPIYFWTEVNVGKGTKLSIPDAQEGPEGVFTLKGKKGGDTLTMLLTIVTEDGKTLLDAPATEYVAYVALSGMDLQPAEQQPQRESVALDYVIPRTLAGVHEFEVRALDRNWTDRYTLKLVKEMK